ncbi:porin family protein [Hymenobacter daeguensis]
MHKKLISLALLLALAGALPSQAQKSRIGLKAGLNLSGFSGPDAAPGGTRRLGLCAGLVIHLPVSPVFSVQPEFLYSQKGANSQPFAISSTAVVAGSQRQHYFEVPVLVKLRSKGGFFGEFGPSLSYLLSASGTFTTPTGQALTLDNRGSFNAFELGYAVGAGFQATQGLLVGLRYGGGFSAIAPTGAYRGISGEPRIYNQNFQLYAGYIFFGRPEPEFAQ